MKTIFEKISISIPELDKAECQHIRESHFPPEEAFFRVCCMGHITVCLQFNLVSDDSSDVLNAAFDHDDAPTRY